MPSNFFTRPFGLHPTPQICFPPPVPTPVGPKRFDWRVDSPIALIGPPAQYHLTVHDPTRPAGEIVNYHVALPALLTPVDDNTHNDTTRDVTVVKLGPAGHYTGVVTIDWHDGSHSHGHSDYVVVNI